MILDLQFAHVNSTYVDQRKYVLYFSSCTDGAGFFNRGNQSWCPYTCVCYNFPPWLRNKFACLFVFGVMPPKIKNYNRTLTCSYHEHNQNTFYVQRMVCIVRAGGGPPSRMQGLHVGI